MPVYADADFFLALIKEEDWLKSNAEKIMQHYKGQIRTNLVAVIEVALVSHRHSLQLEKVFAFIFEISIIDGIDLEECIQVATYVNEYHMSVFDAFHAVLSREMPIISSDKKYDEIGLQRIKLEKK